MRQALTWLWEGNNLLNACIKLYAFIGLIEVVKFMVK